MGLLVINNSLLEVAMQGALAATPGALGAKIALLTDATQLPPGASLADANECDYDGYARSAAVSYTSTYIDGLGRKVAIAEPKVFKPTGNTTTSVCRQVALVDSTGLILLATYMLDEPITFTDENSVYLIGFPLYLAQDRDNPVPDIVP